MAEEVWQLVAVTGSSHAASLSLHRKQRVNCEGGRVTTSQSLSHWYASSPDSRSSLKPCIQVSAPMSQATTVTKPNFTGPFDEVGIYLRSSVPIRDL